MKNVENINLDADEVIIEEDAVEESSLEIRASVTPAVVNFNYGIVKSTLATALAKYKKYVVTADTIASDKKIRAELNNVTKGIADARKKAKKDALKAYEEETEPKFKELEKMVTEVSAIIDKQIKNLETQEKEQKRSELETIWENLKYERVPLTAIWDEKWLNKTISLDVAEREMKKKIDAIENDLETLEALVDNDEDCLTLQAKYLITLDLKEIISQYKREKEEKIKIIKAKEKLEEKENLAKQQEEEDLDFSLDGEEDNPQDELFDNEEDDDEFEDPFEVDLVFPAIFQLDATDKQLQAICSYFKSQNIKFKRRHDLEDL